MYILNELGVHVIKLVQSIILVGRLSFFSSFSLPYVMYDPTDLIWREGTLFEAMTGCIIFIDAIRAETPTVS